MYLRGQIVEAGLGAAHAALVVSETAWNATTLSPVVVPIYEDLAPNVLRPRVPTVGIADCTKPITTREGRLGTVLKQWTGPCQLAVETALRAMLNLDALSDGIAARLPQKDGWVPHHGDIHYSRQPIAGTVKMFVILSDDQWNVRHSYVLGVRLTSNSKPWRLQWEVPLPGGPAIVGDLFPLAVAQLDASAPTPPRPTTTTPRERSGIASGLRLTLGL